MAAILKTIRSSTREYPARLLMEALELMLTLILLAIA